MPSNDYPASVIEVLDDNKCYKPATLRAVKSFAKSKPWRGTLDERKDKFRLLNRELAEAYDLPVPELIFGHIDGDSSGDSYYNPAGHQIVLTGKLSVVTYLHEFAHSRRMGERAACRWSINLFRRCFPRSFSRLVHQGHMLVQPAEITRRKAS